MIATILNAAGSSVGALNYSEQKVARCVAEVADVHNMPSDTRRSIYTTFLERESDPRIAAQTRRFKRHIAFNPGMDDPIRLDRQACVDLIWETLERLGYKDQPAVIYRHNDIEREHYHVVVSAIDSNGKCIGGRYFEAKDVLSVLRDLQEKYDFKVGKVESEEREEVKSLDISYDASKGDIFHQYRDVFDSATLFHTQSFEEFRDVMRSKGVDCTVRKSRGENPDDILVLQGYNAYGDKVMRPVSCEGKLRFLGHQKMTKTIEACKANPADSEFALFRARTAVLTVLESQQYTTVEHFRRVLHDLGLEVVTKRETPGKRYLSDLSVVDTQNGFVFSLDTLGAEIKADILSRESSSDITRRWKLLGNKEARTVIDELNARERLITPFQQASFENKVMMLYTKQCMDREKTMQVTQPKAPSQVKMDTGKDMKR